MNAYDTANELIRLISKYGYEAYLVGGCVRDYIMGRECDDIDIACSAKPNQLEEILDRLNIKYIETGIKHGTVTVHYKESCFEVTTFRTDGEYTDNRHPEKVSFVSSIDGDLARRDFTVNAIAFNEDKGFVDLYGGRKDIESNTIRAVGDADKRFKEDALRIMRAIRFQSVLGFDIEVNTKKAIFDNMDLLKNVSSERIFVELKKLLSGKNVFKALVEYKEVIAVILPEITRTFDCPQNTRWHIYDVWTHTCKAVEMVKNEPELRFIMLLHDIGKPFARTTDCKGVDHFKGHQAISGEMAEPILKRLKVSNDFYNRVMTIIPIHDIHISSDKRKIKKLLSMLGKDAFQDLIDVKRADKLAQNPEMTGAELESLNEREAVFNAIIAGGEAYSVSQLDINGKDISSLGFKGKEIGEALNKLLDAVVNEKVENKKEKLIEYIK